MSDIHGQYDKFMAMLELINFNDEDRLYILGDVVDRGPHSIKILKYIMKNQYNIKMLMGNHDDWMCEYYSLDNKNLNNHQWFTQGGYKTYEEFETYDKSEKVKILYFVNTLEFSKKIEINNNIFYLSHAGFQLNKDGLPFEKQNRDFQIWARREFHTDTNTSNTPKNVYYIFGHTPVVNLPYNYTKEWKIRHYNQKIGIDCGAAYGGKLACLRLDDFKEFYI